MTRWQWLRRFWQIPNVGRTFEMHIQDVQLQAWTYRKLSELRERLDVLEVKVEALIREGDTHGD